MRAMEKLREKYAQATDRRTRRAIAEEVQPLPEVVTHVPLGEWYGVGAVRTQRHQDGATRR